MNTQVVFNVPLRAVAPLVWLCSSLTIPAASAQSMAFTYQGRITENGHPVDHAGLPLTFELFNSPTGGDRIGGPQNSLVPLAQGLFTTTLDFGADAFDGSPRWLAITIDGHPLAPRQQLSPAPYALHALRPWQTAGANVVFPNGNVGIGTSAPARLLQIGDDSTAASMGMIRLGSHSGVSTNARSWEIGVPMTGSDLSREGYSFVIDDIGAGNGPELMVKFGTGNVGIGTVTPGQRLSVAGTIEAMSGGFRFPDGTVQSTAATAGVWTEIGPHIHISNPGRVGIGTAVPQNRLDVSGAVSIGSFFAGAAVAPFEGLIVQGNVGVGTATAAFPLSFPERLGDKISLYGDAGAHYGLGIGEGSLQIHTASSANAIAFGFGSNADFHEGARFTGGGALGIGTTTPQAPLHIRTAPAVGPGWQVVLENAAGVTYAGLRQGDGSLLEATSDAFGNGFARLDTAGNWSAVSDARLKQDIAPLAGLLNGVNALQPVSFRFREEVLNDGIAARTHIGFIAQDVQRWFPALVEGRELLTLNYAGLSVVAIGAIREQQTVITELQSHLCTLHDQVDKLTAENASLRARLDRIETDLMRVTTR